MLKLFGAPALGTFSVLRGQRSLTGLLRLHKSEAKLLIRSRKLRYDRLVFITPGRPELC